MAHLSASRPAPRISRPRPATRRAWLAAILSVLASPGYTYEGQYVQFTVTPSPAIRGLSVRVTGWAAPSPLQEEISLALQPPVKDGMPAAAFQMGETTRDEEGRFEWTSRPLEVAGTWQVKVDARGMDECAEEPLEVAETAAVFGACAQTLGESGRTQVSALTQFRAATADYPATPGQEEALAQAEEALLHLALAQGRIAQFQHALESLTTAATGIPAPEVQSALVEGAQTLATQGEAVSQAQAALVDRIAETRSAAFWCQHWYYQGEVVKETMKLYLKVVALVEGVTIWCLNAMKDALTEGAQSLIDSYLFSEYTPEQQATVRECKENGLVAIREIENALGGFEDIRTPLSTAIDKCTDWVVTDALSNCEKYIGPLEGDVRIDYYLADTPYMRTRYRVGGKAELFFEKRRGPDDVVSLKGKLRGDCRMFIGSMDLRHALSGVPGTDYIAFNIPRYVPRAYLIGVEGEALPDKLRLRLLRPAFTDFGQVMYRFCIILFSAFQLVPLPDVVDIPVPGAEWFFTRVTGTAGGEEWFEVPLSVEGEKSVACRSFEREMDYLATDGFRGYLNLYFKTCSNGCD